MEQLFDLPAHPLLVHLPVVAVPVVTLALAWLVLIPRKPAGLPVVTMVLAVVAGIGLLLAASSGEALVEAVTYLREEPGVKDHINQSESARLWGVVTMLLVVAGYVARRMVGRKAVLATVSKVALALALVTSIATTTFTVQAGHSGAKARWIDIRFPND